MFEAFERWHFKNHIRKQIIQGPHHTRNLENIYRDIHSAMKNEFYEDNKPTLDGFMRGCFESALKSKKKESDIN